MHELEKVTLVLDEAVGESGLRSVFREDSLSPRGGQASPRSPRRWRGTCPDLPRWALWSRPRRKTRERLPKTRLPWDVLGAGA